MRTRARLLIVTLFVIAAGYGAYQLYTLDKLGISADQLGSGSPNESQSVTGATALQQGEVQDVIVTDDGYIQLAPTQ